MSIILIFTLFFAAVTSNNYLAYGEFFEDPDTNNLIRSYG